MFERKFETDVAIKFSIGRIARVPLGCAPNLPARIAIARENRGPGRREAGRVNRAARSRLAKHQPVSVDNKPANTCLPKEILDARLISAFRQPKSRWIGVESVSMRIAARKNLCAHGF